MITKIHMTNLGAHLDTTVSLDQLTVLVGPNGSGKTTVLDALHYLGQLAGDKTFSDIFTGDRAIDWLQRSDKPVVVEVEGECGDSRFEAKMFSPSAADSARNLSRAAFGWRLGPAEGEVPRVDGNSFTPAFAKDQSEASVACAHHLRSMALFRLDARIAAAPASSRHRMPRVEFDGRNLAAALKAIKLGHDEIWSEITELLRSIVPNVKSLGVELLERKVSLDHTPSASAPLVEPSGEWYGVFFNFDGAAHVPASQASEGTILALTLLTILLRPYAPQIVLLDDIEQGLHPAGQMQLVGNLRKLLALDGMKQVQVVATTHSPYVLENLDFNQVRVFALGPDGVSAVKRLDEHPDAERMKGIMSAGELWTSDQEAKWVLEQTP